MAPALLFRRFAMTSPGLRRGQSGFTLIEMLVVLALVAVLMFFSLPALLPMIHQSKLTGIANEVKSLMFAARLNAIKNSCQAVVRIIPADATNPIPQVQAFSDRNSDGQLSAGEPILASFYLPKGVTFRAPPADVTDTASVAAFSSDPGGAALPHIAIFRSDGTLPIPDAGGRTCNDACPTAGAITCGDKNCGGAFSLADENGNYLEVLIPSLTTPIPKLLKWDGGAWRTKGDNKENWQWN
jgi:prepilin-type N-terminal cleavage/methylation domain-containing protein